MSAISSQPSGRACVWCGGTPVTAEHVWPQWIAKYVPQTEIKAEHYVITETEGEAQTTEFRGERVPFTTEARCVCKPCNEGWMAEMEHTAEHELHAMIEGRSQTLHEWRQTIAATWAFKTAIMVEQALTGARVIPSEFYPLFWRYLTPPPYSQVWFGMYAGGKSAHFYGRSQLRFLLTTPEGVAVPNDLTAYGAVLQVGALVFRLFGHLVKDGPVSVPTGEVARSLIPIRPTIARAEWPPELAVNDLGLHILGKSLGDVPPAEGVSQGAPAPPPTRH